VLRLFRNKKPDIPGLKAYILRRVEACEVCGELSVHEFYQSVWEWAVFSIIWTPRTATST